MRIINVCLKPRYFSYASKVGKTLLAGEQSQDISLQTIFNGVLWKDLEAHNIQLKLSDADKTLLAKIVAEDAKPVPIITEIDKPLTSREKAKVKALKLSLIRDAAARKAAIINKLPLNPGGATGQPVFGPRTVESAIPSVLPGQPKSLEDLKRHNKAVPKEVKRAEVPANVPMNPRGAALGQPIFGRGAGAGTGDEGVGKVGKNTMADAATLLGSRF